MRTLEDWNLLIEELDIIRGFARILCAIYVLPILAFLTGAAVCLLDALLDRLAGD